uniref:Uncharacterized protein n=1 Tax=Globodera rostochiensis TaxID=31243 RepID=A0A914GTS1_GLORO
MWENWKLIRWWAEGWRWWEGKHSFPDWDERMMTDGSTSADLCAFAILQLLTVIPLLLQRVPAALIPPMLAVHLINRLFPCR